MNVNGTVKALRALAEKATKGPWQVVENKHPWSFSARGERSAKTGEHIERRIFTTWNHPQSHGPDYVVTQANGIGDPGPVQFVSISAANAAYIAAASPDVILSLLDQLASAIEPSVVTEAVAWPEGFFPLPGDARLRECASEDCHQHVSIRIERDGTGSEHCEPCARKIAAALYATPAPAVADGWRLVPVDPTEAMLDAALYGDVGDYQFNAHGYYHDIWEAMLAAAPAPPAKGGKP